MRKVAALYTTSVAPEFYAMGEGEKGNQDIRVSITPTTIQVDDVATPGCPTTVYDLTQADLSGTILVLPTGEDESSDAE